MIQKKMFKVVVKAGMGVSKDFNFSFRSSPPV